MLQSDSILVVHIATVFAPLYVMGFAVKSMYNGVVAKRPASGLLTKKLASEVYVLVYFIFGKKRLLC